MRAETQKLVEAVLLDWGEYAKMDWLYDPQTKQHSERPSNTILDLHKITAKTGCSISTAYLIRDRAEYLHRSGAGNGESEKTDQA